MTETKGPGTAADIEALRSKAEGALVALAAGDALGWPQELPAKVLDRDPDHPTTATFRPWLRRGGGRFYPHEELIRAGEYSDDTQLTLAVARCRMFEGRDWWRALTRTELPLWTLYERGGGGATKRAARAWTRGTPPWKTRDPRAVRRYFDAGGNGVAMRVLPHAIFYAGRSDPTTLIRDVVTDGVATHGHPRALIGAAAYAFAAWSLLRSAAEGSAETLVRTLLEHRHAWGAFPIDDRERNRWLEAADRATSNRYRSVWARVVDEMYELLERVRECLVAGAGSDEREVLERLGCFGRAKGAGTVSTAAAMYLCARHGARPIEAILRAAFADGADTDTVAAMTGALVGCLGGNAWQPRDWAELQDHAYLRRLARRVVRGPLQARNRPPAQRSIGTKERDELRSSLAHGSRRLDLDGTRHAEVVEVYDPKPLSDSTRVRIWQLQIEDGQTVYVTKLGRKARTGS